MCIWDLLLLPNCLCPSTLNLWACLWGIILIGLIEVGRSTHCGWNQFLTEIRECVSEEGGWGWGRHRSPHSSLPTSSLGIQCEQLPNFKSWSRKNPFFFKLLLPGYFITATEVQLRWESWVCLYLNGWGLIVRVWDSGRYFWPLSLQTL